MKGLITMIAMTVLWYKRRVTLYQKGRIIAIGKVSLITDAWVVVKKVQMLDGEKKKLAVARNRIDLFWEAETGDEKKLQPLAIACDSGQESSEE